MPRSYLTLDEKLRIIDYSEEHRISLRKLARIFKVGKSLVGEIIKRKDEIRGRFVRGGEFSTKRPSEKPRMCSAGRAFELWCGRLQHLEALTTERQICNLQHYN